MPDILCLDCLLDDIFLTISSMVDSFPQRHETAPGGETHLALLVNMSRLKPQHLTYKMSPIFLNHPLENPLTPVEAIEAQYGTGCRSGHDDNPETRDSLVR